MKKFFLSFLVAGLLGSCNNKADESTASQAPVSGDSSTNKARGYELADTKYSDIGKKGLALFAAGDFDNWVNMYAENAVYLWSAGDSLVGKKAIADYWKNRRKNYIDSMSIKYDIWIPIQVNQPQQGPDQAGVWLLNWHQPTVKYKSGKKITFWVHADFHFNENGLVDRSVHYVDRAPIEKAIAGK